MNADRFDCDRERLEWVMEFFDIEDPYHAALIMVDAGLEDSLPKAIFNYMQAVVEEEEKEEKSVDEPV